jgi:hypothetical protein
MQKPN